MGLVSCAACKLTWTSSKYGQKILYGDSFYRYYCGGCRKEGEKFERLPLSWVNIIQLVLYHLHKTDRIGMGYFRWKEDICRLIDDRWEDLCPTKQKTASWMNSVSSVLSANPSMFESGFGKLKQPGWWALKCITPPPAINVATARIAIDQTRNAALSKEYSNTADDDDDNDIESDVVDVGEEERPLAEHVSAVFTEPLLTKSTYVNSYPFRYEYIPSVTSLLPSLDPATATPSTMRAAEEIKRKLVERLLRVDSKLLKEALSNAPNGNIAFSRSMSTPPFITDRESPLAFLPDRMVREEGPRNVKSSASSPGPPELLIKEKLKLAKIPKPANYVRASPHENELLELCLRVREGSAPLNRLKRKLIIRRLKRRAGLRVFEIDSIMYKYLKSTEPLRISRNSAAQPTLHDVEPASTDRQTFFDIPFQRDPSLSFKAKLLGVSNVLDPYPAELISPYTGLRLPAIIHSETNCRPAKLALLQELRSRAPMYDGDLEDATRISEIRFIHFRKEWLPQVNRLLREFFWPSVDSKPPSNWTCFNFVVCEYLDYPDFGILVMYQKLVIGCAFMTPDGYLTYFFVHPEWSNAGLGNVLLHLLLSRVAPPNQDITLHVSVSNPALILYQKFGFKPEQFIVNFYDKYFASSSDSLPDATASLHRMNKNALFIRLRR